MTSLHPEVPTWSVTADDPTDRTFDDLRNLRAQAPVVHSEDFGGFWAYLTHAGVRAALRNPDTFRSDQPFINRPREGKVIPLTTNKPEHTRYRTFLQKYFTAPLTARLEPAVRDIVVAHVQPLIGRGGGDAVEAIARPVPSRVLCAFLGIPDEFADRMKVVSDKNQSIRLDAANRDEAVEHFRAVDREMLEIANEMVELRRAEPGDPDTDLVSGLLARPVGNEQLSTDEISAITVQMIAAGHSTTTRAISSLLHAVATDQEAQQRLRDQPAERSPFIEEVLRLAPPLHMLGRTPATDVEAAGHTIKAGEYVGLHFGAANRDPAVFPSPDSLNPQRTPNPHLTFGFGAHVCMGAPIARLELLTLLEELFARTDDIELQGEATAIRGFQSGFEYLPLRLTSAS